jgi:hypothetical protein
MTELAQKPIVFIRIPPQWPGAWARCSATGEWWPPLLRNIRQFEELMGDVAEIKIWREQEGD